MFTLLVAQDAPRGSSKKHANRVTIIVLVNQVLMTQQCRKRLVDIVPTISSLSGSTGYGPPTLPHVVRVPRLASVLSVSFPKKCNEYLHLSSATSGTSIKSSYVLVKQNSL